jgi:hypothetical protein
MIFTEDELHLEANPFRILDGATYLTEQEVRMQPQMVPVMENYRLQSYLIDFNGVRQLSESVGINYLDAAVLVAEQDGIDPSQACIVIDEADLIENPELASLGSIVVRPLSEADEQFQFCLEAIDQYLDTYNNAVLDQIFNVAILDEGSVLSKAKKKIKQNIQSGKVPVPGSWSFPSSVPPIKVPIVSQPKENTPPPPETSDDVSGSSAKRVFSKIGGIGHKVKKTVNDVVEKAVDSETKPEPKPTSNDSDKQKNDSFGRKVKNAITGDSPQSSPTSWGRILGKSAVYTAAGVGLGTLLGKGYLWYRDKPRSVIAKRIAALRQTYSKFMIKAQKAPNEGIKNNLKRIAGKILSVIDKLMALLQRKADHC